MTKMLRAAAVAMGMAFAPTTMAQVALDLKVAYALPIGDVWVASPWNPAWTMTSVWTGAVPVEVAARYRFTPNISVGPYFQWGPAFTTSTGFDSISGSAGTDMRLGLELVYGFAPDAGMNPWASYGMGWEWTKYSGTKSGQSAAVTVNGWEYLNFQVGLDFKLARAFAVGPYVGFSAGTYSSIVASGASNTGPGGNYGGSVDLAARAFHGWFQFGVKGTLNL